MDEKNFLNLLKNLQSVMSCPSCGSIYEVSEIQFLGKKDGYFLLSLTCNSCSLPVWLNFFAGKGHESNYISSDLTAKDSRLMAKSPISTSEVIDFHLFLKNFKGDFIKEFKK